MIKVGIYGAPGYTGFELVKLLQRHGGVEVVFATSNTFAGKTMRDVYPSAPAIGLTPHDEADPALTDVVFLCLPHAAAAGTAIKCLEAGTRVIDLSADFRLKDADEYEAWYGLPHPAPALLEEAVYGLTEFAREALPNARLVANPGCYPTTVQLGLQPVVAEGLVTGTIIVDSKSGVSGAGRKLSLTTHFVEAANNFSPYKIGRAHRHLPEIEQGLRVFNESVPDVIFSPHLLPVPRGIVSTIYAPLAEGVSLAEVRALYEVAYGDEQFVHVLPEGELSTLAHVVRTNNCVISLTMAGSMLVVVSSEDNLVKGAAGQAVQNMNVMFGMDEGEGLL